MVKSKVEKRIEKILGNFLTYIFIIIFIIIFNVIEHKPIAHLVQSLLGLSLGGGIVGIYFYRKMQKG